MKESLQQRKIITRVGKTALNENWRAWQRTRDRMRNPYASWISKLAKTILRASNLLMRDKLAKTTLRAFSVAMNLSSWCDQGKYLFKSL